MRGQSQSQSPLETQSRAQSAPQTVAGTALPASAMAVRSPVRRSLRRRLALQMPLVAAGAWVLALVAVLIPTSAGWLAGVGWSVTALLLADALVRRRTPLPFVIVLAATAAVTQVALAQPDRTAFERAALQHAVTVEISVTTKVEPAWAGAWRFSGQAVGVDDDAGIRAPAAVIFTGDRDPRLDLGATVRVTAKGVAARPGDSAVALLRPARAPEVIAAPAGVFTIASALRQNFVALAAAFPGSGGQLMPGLAVGDTSAVADDLDQAMKTTGLSHLTAVSGSNCSLVAGAAFGLCALLRQRRWVRVAAAVAALAAFVVLVTPEASVMRAAVMSTIAMLAVLLGRPGAGFAVLGAAVTVLLIADPWLATSVGFALSAAATGALLALAEPIARTLTRVMPYPLALALAVPLAAQLACAPILVLISPSVSIGSVLANLIAGPAAPLATIVGMLACFLATVPVVSTALGAIAWVPAQWIGSTAQALAAAPGVEVPWWEGPAGAIGLAVLSSAVGVLLVRPPSRLLLRLSALLVAVSVGVAGGLFALRTVVAPLTVPSAWSIAMCDVGQGDAVLIRDSGVVMGVDTGEDEASYAACLRRLGVDRIDVLVLTHFDADHAGAAPAVSGRIGIVLHGPPDEQAGALLDRLEHDGATLVSAQPGMAGEIGRAQFTVLWPMPGARPGNDASVVIDIAGPGIPHTLLLGDLSEQAQRAMISAGELRPPYAIVKVSHHGSADQAETLYQLAAGSLALIGVGENTYGHPRQETLAMLRRSGMRIARTDRSGLLLVTGADDGRIRLWVERGDDTG